MTDGWAGTDSRIILALLVGAAVIALWSLRTHRIIARRARIREAAGKNNEIICAALVKQWVEWIESDNDNNAQRRYHGAYEFVVGGETKTYSIWSDVDVPSKLDLYYDEATGKFFSDYDRVNLGYNVGILLGIAALLLTLFFTGYIGFGSIHV